MTGRRIVAVDLGATHTRIAVFNGRSRASLDPYVSCKCKTPRTSNGERLAAWLADQIATLAGDPEAISIASFGPIDYSDRSIVDPPNHPARKIPLGRIVERRFPNSYTLLVNDAVAGAWSDHVLSGVEDLAYVAVGTGVGVGVVVGGRLLLGRRGDSHEAGHMVIDYKSRIRCGCGGRGHWEAIGSGSALEALRLASRDIETVTAAGIAGLVACYDPERVSLGGGLVTGGVIRVDRIRSVLKEYSFQNRIPDLVVHPAGDNANLIGAYLLLLEPDRGVLALNGWA
ncbi:MAG: ROK family protein [Desulfurococcales archaeon]|nr:ROK family protein [Desulfurococcales archaeon]